MQPYPRNIRPDEKSTSDALNIISRLRDQDIIDRNTFPAIFLLGRRVNRLPTNNADVLPSDRLGDWSVTSTFAYYLVLDGVTPKWGRWVVDVTW